MHPSAARPTARCHQDVPATQAVPDTGRMTSVRLTSGRLTSVSPEPGALNPEPCNIADMAHCPGSYQFYSHTGGTLAAPVLT